MGKIEDYRRQLRSLPAEEWPAYLCKESGLPGPRGNLELLEAVYLEGNLPLFQNLLAISRAPEADEVAAVYLAMAGIIGLARYVASGEKQYLAEIRRAASDSHWRIREGSAIALQHWGKVDMPQLVTEMSVWADGSWLEKRAVAAALCEPVLLKEAANAGAVLSILDRITTSLVEADDRRGDDFRVLRQALAYCWSVAAVALPPEGKRLMEKWLASGDKDIRWIMKENLKKNRLQKMDEPWVKMWLEKFS